MRHLEEKKYNPFRFVETYDDVFWLVDMMLLERDRPTSLREYECDQAFLAALVGFVFDVHMLFALPVRDDEREHCFEILHYLVTLSDDDALLDNMIVTQLRDGKDYDRKRHRWVASARPKHYNALSAVEWRKYRSAGPVERDRCYRRCQALVKALTTCDAARFRENLLKDRTRRELMLIGCL